MKELSGRTWAIAPAVIVIGLWSVPAAGAEAAVCLVRQFA